MLRYIEREESARTALLVVRPLRFRGELPDGVREAVYRVTCRVSARLLNQRSPSLSKLLRLVPELAGDVVGVALGGGRAVGLRGRGVALVVVGVLVAAAVAEVAHEARRGVAQV